MGVPYDVEAVRLETAQVPHVALYGPQRVAIVPGGLAVAFELRLREIKDRDLRTQQEKGSGLLPAASGQAQHLFARRIIHLAFRIDQHPGSSRVQMQLRPGEQHPGPGQFLPAFFVESR